MTYEERIESTVVLLRRFAQDDLSDREKQYLHLTLQQIERDIFQEIYQDLMHMKNPTD